MNSSYRQLIHKKGPWKGLDEVGQATLTLVDWFNHQRLLESIGDIPPIEFEKMYYEHELAKAA